MKTNNALLVAISLVTQIAIAQQNAPSPANVSTAPPQKYSAEEMSRFRAMQPGATPSSRRSAQFSLGDNGTDVPPSKSARPSVQATSYQTNSADVGIDSSAPENPPSTTEDEKGAAVPAILSGKPTNAPAISSETSPMMPDDVSMNQTPTQATSPQVSGNGSFPMTQSNGKSIPKSTGLPAMKTYIKPKVGGSALAPSMPNPGQAPVDLRRDASQSSQANRAAPVPGRIATVSGKQEPAESLNGSAIPATANPTGVNVPDGGVVMNPSSPRDSQPSAIVASANPAGLNAAPGAARTMTKTTDDQTTINTPGAAIGVSTTGPKTISIGKNATYGVVVSNTGQAAAQQLEVTFTVPTWIELANTNLTTGSKELVRETDATRVVWRMDRLEPGKTQRLSLDVIPRKAQVFDLNVEWSVAPLMGAVQVQVTEPLLKMSITGPDEVQFGQSAMYSVVIQNPGTGTAENVNVMLSEALGGERAPLGNLAPGEEKNIQVELIARSAGALDLSAAVTGDGDLQDSATKKITVRRAALDVAIAGPNMKYAGSTGNYQITVENTGDAVAQDVFAAIGFPVGAQYISGVEGAEKIEGGMRWSVGALPPGAQRTYTIICQLTAAGPLTIETGVRGSGDLADADSIQTTVETEADLVLAVDDPQGPLPIGQDATYKLSIKNRGTKTANGIDVVMHFSTGIEPTSAEGREHKINPGEIAFETIGQLEPGEEMVFAVTARATVPGTHEFRAQLTCEEADAREVAGGTTKFFGDDAFETNSPDPSIQLGAQPMLNSIRQ